jgi:predicted O-linked N-acetylglucosamine transferase (SPINDLY family)
VRLANDRIERDALRARVQQAAQTGSLFDMAGYAHDFEAALQHMFQRFGHDQQITDFEAGR